MWWDELAAGRLRRDLEPGAGGGEEEPSEPEGGRPPEPEGGPPPEPWDPPEPEGGPAGGPPDEPERPSPPRPPSPPEGPGGDEDPDPIDAPGTEEVRIYEWRTARDARVCPICGPLDGARWEGDDGPWPPAHLGCRCARVLVAVEERTLRRAPRGGPRREDGAWRRW